MSAPDGSETNRVDYGGDLRQVAAAAGDLHGELLQRIPRLVQLSSEERAREAVDGLERLQAEGVVTEAEAANLSAIVRSLGATEGTPQEQADRVAHIEQQLVAANAGPVALTLAGIASNGTRRAAQLADEAGQGADIGDFSTVGECACAGGIVGATAGIVGGPAGVLLGAAAGAAGGAIGGLIAQALKE